MLQIRKQWEMQSEHKDYYVKRRRKFKGLKNYDSYFSLEQALRSLHRHGQLKRKSALIDRVLLSSKRIFDNTSGHSVTLALQKITVAVCKF